MPRGPRSAAIERALVQREVVVAHALGRVASQRDLTGARVLIVEARYYDAIQDALLAGATSASVPHPARLGQPDEFAALALHIVENSMINGETIRLDGALRMAPR